jgi:hypothetical protein
LAVKKDLGYPPVDTGHKDQVLKYLTFKGEPHVVDVPRLKEWVGPVPELREFDQEDQRQGVFFRVIVNLKRLACLLEPLTSDKVTLWDSTGVGVRCIGLGGESWRIVLGGVDRDLDEPLEEDEEPDQFFSFEEKPQSAFDRAMALLEEG